MRFLRWLLGFPQKHPAKKLPEAKKLEGLFTRAGEWHDAAEVKLANDTRLSERDRERMKKRLKVQYINVLTGILGNRDED